MQAYGAGFAAIYNLRWGRFASHAAPILRTYFESTLAQPLEAPRLLDLCCGSGVLTVHFLEAGYQAIGLDLSTPMLEYARQNCAPFIVAGQARFIQGDAADYHLEEPVHLAVATFDALNHLPDLTALQACFRCTAQAVLPSGTFLFDLNTRHGLQRWASSTVEENAGLTLFTHGLYDELTGRAYTRISGFLRADDGRYDRFEETAYNTAFDLTAVEAALHETGWEQVHFARLEDLAAPLDDPEQVERVFIVARK
jgi:SAM-dependent methyltransferase